MSFTLVRTSAFIRAAKRFVKRKPSVATELERALLQLHEDPFHPSLKTHRLKGDLSGSWACSAGYDLRIIFSFLKQQKSQAILLETVGTHDDVY
jgi:mRNA interferase YafQ